jgi:hypothetical protein
MNNMKNELIYKLALAGEINPKILEVTENLSDDLRQINFEAIKIILADTDYGFGWSTEKCERAEILYKRIQYLFSKNPSIYFPIEILNFIDKIHNCYFDYAFKYFVEVKSLFYDSTSIMRLFINWYSTVADFRSYKYIKPKIGYACHHPVFAINFKPKKNELNNFKKEVLQEFVNTKKLYFDEFGEELNLKNLC